MLQVGNEFGQVEGLWSMFENVMAQNQSQEEESTAGGADGKEEERS